MKKTLLIILFLASVAQADVYKWTDANGQVHYGDQPKTPSQADSQKMEINEDYNAQDILPADRKEKRKKLLEVIEEERKKDKELAEKKAKKEAKLVRQCHEAKDRLQHFYRARSLYDLDKDGNRVTLPSSAKDRAISQLEKQIAEHCN